MLNNFSREKNQTHMTFIPTTSLISHFPNRLPKPELAVSCPGRLRASSRRPGSSPGLQSRDHPVAAPEAWDQRTEEGRGQVPPRLNVSQTIHMGPIHDDPVTNSDGFSGFHGASRSLHGWGGEMLPTMDTT